MSLDRSDVENIAQLARLRIEEQDTGQYASSLSSILNLADQLQAVDTDGVEPLANPLDATQRLRADEVTESDHRDEYQEVAPLTGSGLFLVPKVIE